MKQLLIILLLFSPFITTAQIEIPKGAYMSDHHGSFSTDTLYIHSIIYNGVNLYNTKSIFVQDSSDRYDLTFYLLDSDNNILILGHFFKRHSRGYLTRYGQWKKFYTNGNIMSSGQYNPERSRYNFIAGNWKHYYNNGNLKEDFNISVIEQSYICTTGRYKLFHPNGRLKIKGNYIAQVDTNNIDTAFIDNPETGEIIMEISKTPKQKPSKIGTWYYYKESGELERKEEY